MLLQHVPALRTGSPNEKPRGRCLQLQPKQSLVKHILAQLTVREPDEHQLRLRWNLESATAQWQRPLFPAGCALVLPLASATAIDTF